MMIWRMVSRLATFDVVVVGGGHAGCEAAYAAASMGARTCLLTQSRLTIGEMSCNPSMGGVGKGHLMREVEALGGLIGKISDLSATHYRMLNTSKGYSAQGLRAIIDRDLYRQHMLSLLEKVQGLTIEQRSVEDFTVEGNTISIIQTNRGQVIGKCVVVATGTFLRGRIHIGRDNYPAGRHRRDTDQVEPASTALAQTLHKYKFPISRLKTGTPPRLRAGSINFAQLQVQKSMRNHWFSYQNEFNQVKYPNGLMDSYVTETNEGTHQIIRRNIHLLPTYQKGKDGLGIGPRYCPSIEAKLLKFPTKLSHSIFLQHEGLNSDIVYPTGISTALPFQIQRQLLQTIKGLEHAEIVRPAYGIEYDFVDPRHLNKSLQSTLLNNLFLAGQINGTTGYEQAAAQGIIAGINAACLALGRPFLELQRTSSMIGVLIDDITSQGVTEPYRMLTTRSQFRLTQRFDNADQRLTHIGILLGIVQPGQRKVFEEKQLLMAEGLKRMQAFTESTSKWKKMLNNDKITVNASVKSALQIVQDYQTVHVRDLVKVVKIDERVVQHLNFHIKYRRVIENEERTMAKVLAERIDQKLDMGLIEEYRNNFPAEEYEKIERARPTDLYAASRIQGIRSTTLMTLTFLAKRKQKAAQADDEGLLL